MNQTDHEIQIVKASGEKDIYDRKKLMRSLVRSGASESTAAEVASEVERDLREGISTRKIYRKAFRVLRRQSVRASSQYKLKQAVMQLGPSGYPFEHFVAEIFKASGYDVKVSQLMDGQCVKHEVDVVGYKGNRIVLAECKFRNQPGSKTDVKVALYVHSRFNDLKAAIDKSNGLFLQRLGFRPHSDEPLEYEGCIVTNAKFTEDAIQYAKCSGITLIGWDYPSNLNLLELIGRTGLLPITLLESISRNDMNMLTEQGIVVCRELAEKIEIIEKLGIDKSKKRRLIQELEAILEQN